MTLHDIYPLLVVAVFACALAEAIYVFCWAFDEVRRHRGERR